MNSEKLTKSENNNVEDDKMDIECNGYDDEEENDDADDEEEIEEEVVEEEAEDRKIKERKIKHEDDDRDDDLDYYEYNNISDDYDSSSDDDNEDADMQFLKTLQLLTKFNAQKKKEEKKKFLPMLKAFFKANMKQKHKLFNSSLKSKIKYLATNILNKKIRMLISPEYIYILKKLVKHKLSSDDFKIIVCEDQCIGNIFERACRLIERSQK